MHKTIVADLCTVVLKPTVSLKNEILFSRYYNLKQDKENRSSSDDFLVKNLRPRPHLGWWGVEVGKPEQILHIRKSYDSQQYFRKLSRQNSDKI